MVLINSERKIFAGLAIHDGKLFFVQLDKNQNVVKNFTIELPADCTEENSVKNFDALTESFSRLQNLTGKINFPVVLGLPAGDVIIQALNFPELSDEDLRGALATNFEDYFDFPCDEAIFDVTRVKTPSGFQSIAFAARKETIKNFLEAAEKSNIFIGAIEPEIFAVLRAVPELQEGLCVFANSRSIAATWQGRGIFFRTTDKINCAQDINNTLQYVSTYYRNANVNKLILCGADETKIEAGINITDEFIEAKGLAMRGENNFLDLRTEEYVKSQRRKKFLNPYRIIFLSFFSLFIFISLGAIIFSRFHSVKLRREILSLLSENENILQRRTQITALNSQLENKKNQAAKIFDFLKDDIPVLKILNAIEENSEGNIKFSSLEISRGSAILSGRAENDRTILFLTKELQDSNLFSEVAPPISQKENDGQISFKILMKVSEIF